jgi:hypothetical protein
MSSKNSGSNYPHSSKGQKGAADQKYNTPAYYQQNQRLADTSSRSGNQGSSFEKDTLNTQYDELNTGKYEQY